MAIKDTLKLFFKKNIADGNFVIFLFIVTIALLKFSTNLVFFYTKSSYSLYSSLANYLLSFVLIIFIGIFEYGKAKYEFALQRTLDEQKNKFVNDYLFVFAEIFVVILAHFALSKYSNTNIFSYTSPTNILTSNIIFVLFSIASVRMLSFVYYWLIFRRYKLTKFAIIATFFIGIIIHTARIIEFYFHYNILQILEVIEISPYTLFYIWAGFLVFRVTRNFSWIATLKTNKKIAVIFISFTTIILSAIVPYWIYEEQNIQNVDFFLAPAFGMYLIGSLVIFVSYSIKIAISAVAALPTSKIIDKKSAELSSLNNIYQQIIATEINFDSFLKNIIINAKNSIGAPGVWCELYENSADSQLELFYCENIATSEIEAAHRLNWLKPLFVGIKEPQIIESVPNDKMFKSLADFISNLGSAAIIPIISNQKRIGTIFLTHNKEYKLEAENLILLQILFDIMNSVYNNAEVVRKSIAMSKELVLGQQIQEKLLPQNLPDFGKYSVAVYSKSAKEVGGDYYDFVTLANGKSCILIGDVSGKGMTAAFVMAYVKGIVIGVAAYANSPKELLILVNSSLKNDIDKQLFITMLAFVIDDEAGKITFARAGHTPLLAKIGENCEYFTPSGIGIGLLGKNNLLKVNFSDKLEEISLNLAPGDFCVLFTDGLNEIMNSENEEFGFDRIRESITNFSCLESTEIINLILDRVNNFTEQTEQNDDITILVVGYK